MLLSDMTQLYFTIFLSRDVVKHICKIVLVSRGSPISISTEIVVSDQRTNIFPE